MLVCLLTAGFDAATSRIPNPITYTAMILGLLLNGIPSLATLFHGPDLWRWFGAAGIAQSFYGFIICAAIGLVCLTLAGMGGGDLKLLAAIGSLLGLTQSMDVLLWTLALAVPYSLVNLLFFGRLNGVLRTAGQQLLQIAYLHRFEPVTPPSRTMIPLAVPLLLAMFCVRIIPPAWVSHWLTGA